MVVQWLRLHASNLGGVGSIPGQGTKIPHAKRCIQTNIRLEAKLLKALKKYLVTFLLNLEFSFQAQVVLRDLANKALLVGLEDCICMRFEVLCEHHLFQEVMASQTYNTCHITMSDFDSPNFCLPC